MIIQGGDSLSAENNQVEQITLVRWQLVLRKI